MSNFSLLVGLGVCSCACPCFGHGDVEVTSRGVYCSSGIFIRTTSVLVLTFPPLAQALRFGTKADPLMLWGSSWALPEPCQRVPCAAAQPLVHPGWILRNNPGAAPGKCVWYDLDCPAGAASICGWGQAEVGGCCLLFCPCTALPSGTHWRRNQNLFLKYSVAFIFLWTMLRQI